MRNQGDIVLHDPQDTGNPTVAITSPTGTTWHKASGASHITISGTAFDTISGVASVQVKIGTGGQYQNATYDAATYTWSYNWQNPPTGTTRIYAKATDFAGNPTEVYKDVTVSNVTVVYVKSGSSGNGTSWANAYGSLGEALAYTSSGELWVAEGTYVGEYVLVSGVSVYGGFAGNEIVREQRDWKTHETVLQASGVSYGVLGVGSNTTVDGFVVRGNGESDSGSGIFCLEDSSNIEISHNEITNNNDSGIYCGADWQEGPANINIHDNYIHDNQKSWNGCDGINLYNCDGPIRVVNNTICSNSDNGISIFDCGEVEIYNNIVTDNNVGVYASNNQSLTLSNNTVWDNTTNYSGVQPVNPVDQDPKLNSVHIAADSPCIDAGDTGEVLGSLDIDGDARVQGEDVDIGTDEYDVCLPNTITFTCDPAYAEPEESVVVTVHVAEWDGDPVADGTWVGLNETDGTITHVNGEETSGPQYYGFTDDGDVTVTVTRETAGVAQLTATVSRLCDEGLVSKSRHVWFTDDDLSNVDLIFLIDVTGSTSQGIKISNGVTDTVNYLAQELAQQGRTFRVAGIKFSGNYAPYWRVDPSYPYSWGVLYDFTTDPAAFNDWVDLGGLGGGAEYQLDIMMCARDMAPTAVPGLYMALATDENSDSSYTVQQVAAALTQAGCIVFVDPGQEVDLEDDQVNLIEYYSELAVNDGAIEQEAGNLGTFTFQHMREAILLQ